MNFVEAYKTGKRFKRKNYKDWMTQDSVKSTLGMAMTDILGEDWEVEEEKRELSWGDIDRAIRQTYPYFNPTVTGLKELLGFKV